MVMDAKTSHKKTDFESNVVKYYHESYTWNRQFCFFIIFLYSE